MNPSGVVETEARSALSGRIALAAVWLGDFGRGPSEHRHRPARRQHRHQLAGLPAQLVPVPGYPIHYAPQLNSNFFFYDGLYWVYQGDNWYAST
jgi:hypothetical protein